MDAINMFSFSLTILQLVTQLFSRVPKNAHTTNVLNDEAHIR